MSRKVKFIFVAAVFFLVLSSSAFADLTGRWAGNDTGTYYIKQIGNEVMWYGESSVTSPNWSNVAHGTFSNGNLILRWADVPKGNAMQSGILILRVSPNGRQITAVTKTGGFGGSSWTKR